MAHLVLGIGMSSKATRQEVRELVDKVIGQAAVRFDAVSLVATRMRFVDDDRARFGPLISASTTVLSSTSTPHRSVPATASRPGSPRAVH